MAETLIIYASPNEKGHSRKALDLLILRIDHAGKDFEVIDLYKDEFDPVMTKEEHYTSRGNKISNATARYQKKIKEAKHIFIIHPMWWGSMPAMLKGFFDKVFTPGFAYHFKKNKIGPNMPIGHFKGKRAAVMTTSGGPEFYSRYILFGRQTKALRKDILEFVGMKAKTFLVGDSTKLTLKQECKLSRNVDRAIKFCYRA